MKRLAIQKKKKIFYLFLLIVIVVFNQTSCSLFSRKGDQALTMELKAEGMVDSAGMRNTVHLIKSRLLKYGIEAADMYISFHGDEITVKVAHVDNPERITSLVSKRGSLEFWETYDISEIYSQMANANSSLAKILYGDSLNSRQEFKKDNPDTAASAKESDTVSLVEIMKNAKASKDLSDKKAFEEYEKENPLFAYLIPNLTKSGNGSYYLGKGPNIGYCKTEDTSKVNKLLSVAVKKKLFTDDIIFCWDAGTYDETDSLIWLIALKYKARDNGPVLDGSVLVNALQDFDKSGEIIITLEMNSYGSNKWKRITSSNVGKCIAMVLDGYVYSYPKVQSEIHNGRSILSGNFTVEEGKDLATLLSLGKLPYQLKVLKSESTEEK